MTKLRYLFTNDSLFKMLFVKNTHLLQRLTAVLLDIPNESIKEFRVTNPNMPPIAVGAKFCQLDINMLVDGCVVDLEIQVADEGNYPERCLYYWAREYSSALGTGEDYSALPRTIVISIAAFELFDCKQYHSEFQLLEVTRHTLLTDKQVFHFYELPKLPKTLHAENELMLWLTLFKAQTEEELKQIEELGVPVMQDAIKAYRQITATDEFKELEQLLSRARHNETSALNHARREAAKKEAAKWQGEITELHDKVTKKEVIIADQSAAIVDFKAKLAEKEATVAKKDVTIAEKEALIATLMEKLAEKNDV